MHQNLSNLELKLLTDSADTTLSGKLFHTDTALCEKNSVSSIHVIASDFTVATV